MSSESSPRMDEFVAKIVSDPANPPNTVLLSGYVGAASEEGYTRLYFDLELSSYMDIPNDAILHAQPLEVGSHLWIRREALLKPGRGVAQAAQARYFQGEIMKRYGAGAAELQAQAANAPDIVEIKASELFRCRTEQGLACPRTLSAWNCRSEVDGCPSTPEPCPETLPGICLDRSWVWCPTEWSPACPTVRSYPLCVEIRSLLCGVGGSLVCGGGGSLVCGGGGSLVCGGGGSLVCGGGGGFPGLPVR